jgi:hypothetical protein
MNNYNINMNNDNELLDETIEKINAGEKFTPISNFKNDDEARRYFAAIANNERRLINAARAKISASEEAKNQATRQRIEDQQRNEALTRWKMAGGDAATFEAAWPQLQRQMLMNAATQQQQAAPAFTVRF